MWTDNIVVVRFEPGLVSNGLRERQQCLLVRMWVGRLSLHRRVSRVR